MRAENNGNDLELLASRAISGDQAAFGKLVERTQRVTYPLALRLVGGQAEAEDVLQDAYIRVWQGLSKLRDRGAVLGWICRIVRNVAVDRVRYEQRRPSGGDALIEYIASDDPGPEQAIADAEARGALLDLVDQLKQKHRVVLLLREVDGMSYEEIAAALGCKIGTVESRLHRARKQLADKVKRQMRAQAKESA